jgi:predicted glutamine amidotransferase
MKKFLIIALMLFSVGFIVADCRLMMMAGYGNETLSETNNQTALTAFFEELQDQGGSTTSFPYWNADGWGLGYYLPGDTDIVSVYRSDDPAYGDSYYDAAQTVIQNAGAHLVIGHVRKATSGSTGIPDPNPFIWNENGIDYCFAHNGTLDPPDLDPPSDNSDDLYDMLYYPFNVLQTDVDSEIYFLWVMQNLDENDWNILDGLHAAIQGLSVLEDDWNMNFVLSDGVDIYAYRNAIDVYHELCFGWKTESSAYPTVNKFRVVMSTLPSVPNIGMTEMPNDALLYYPANGRTTLLNDFSDAQPQYKRSLSSGWNWEGMPSIPSISGSSNAEALLADLTDDGITQVLAQNGSMIYNSAQSVWNHTNLYNLNWNELYKMSLGSAVAWFIETGNGKGYEVTGYIRDSDTPTLTDIEAQEEYWISYTLLPTQNMDDAFGDEWENVYSVKSKDWTYMDLTYPEGGRGSEPVPSMQMRALEFGKGYIVKFKDDIDSFTWNYERVPGSVEIPEESESKSFSYTELADYEAIDIMEIEGVENIQEIGVFEDNVCVGAVVTNELPVQIRAYTTTAGRELTFQVVEGSRSLPEKKSYSVYNFDRQQYENKSLRSGQQSYSMIKLGRDDYEITVPSKKISNLNNFPNPFNPITAISFSLSSETSIELNIYNTKGQLVRTLISGRYTSGSHSVAWDGNDNENKPVSSGLYLYKLKTSDHEYSKKMLLLK